MAITGIVKSVSGNVTATDVNGIVRTLRVGDRVSSDETISTGNAAGTTISIAFSNGTQMDLGGGSVVALNEDMLTPDASGSKEAAGQSSQQAQDDVARIQEAIANGEDFDPSKLPATAAGGAAGAGGAGDGNNGHTFVEVKYLNPSSTPDSGFNTTGISVAFPVQEDVLILNPAQPVPSSPLPIVSVDVEVKVIPSAENPQSPVEERATTPGVVVDGVAIVEGTDAGNRIVNFVIQLDKVFDQDVTVTYEINGITATGGSDFTGVLTGTITIPAGQTSFTVPVEIVQDSNLETNETFQITLTSATNAVISSNGNSATVSIIDDDVNADNDIDSTNEAFLQANEYAFTGNVNVLSNDDLSNAVQSDGTTPLFGPLLVTTTGPVDAFVNGDPASVGTITFTSAGAYTLVLNEHGQNLVNGLGVNDSFVVSANYSIINQADSTDTATLSITINGSNDIPNINVDPGNEGADGIVYEAALATIGSDPDSNSETTTGQFTISDPDGLGDIAKVTVTNGAVTETFTVAQLAGATQQSPLTIVGQYGTLSITGYDSDTGVATYSYELTKSYTSADGSAPSTEDNKDVFTLTTTDKSDATSAPAVINIDIVDDNPSVSVGTVADSAITLTTQDAQTIGAASDTDSASFASAFLAAVTPTYGADGAGSTVISGYTLSVDSATSGLFSNGLAITLAKVGNDVVGSTTAGEVFRISVATNGTVTLTQSAELDHVEGTSQDAQIALAAGKVTLSATATVTDGDGDTATTTVSTDLGGNIRFDDDNPSVSVGTVADSAITLTTQDAQTIGAASDTDSASFASAFLAAVTPTYGADGAGSTVISGYTLSVDSATSGLFSNGLAITLAKVGNDVVGSTTAGEVFRISVATNGTVTLTQSAELDHVEGTSQDAQIALAAGKVTLSATATVTDGDGDTATTTVSTDLGGNIRFDDDVPLIGPAQNGIIANEKGLTLTGTVSITEGADGATVKLTSTSYTTEGGVKYWVDSNGHVMTSDGVKLLYVENADGSLSAIKSGTSNHVFDITINQASDTYSVTQSPTYVLDGASTSTTIDFTSSLGGGNTANVFFGAAGVLGWATSRDSSTVGVDTVNFSTQGMGVNTGATIAGTELLSLVLLDSTNWTFSSSSNPGAPTYDGTGNKYISYTTANITVDSLDTGESMTLKAYYHDVNGNLVEVALVQNTFAGTGQGSSTAADDIFTVTSNDGHAFDTLVFEAPANSDYRVASLTGTSTTQGIEQTINVTGTVTDGDGDTASTSWNITFDGNNVLQGTDQSDVLVGGAGNDILNGGGGNDILVFDMADMIGTSKVYDGGLGEDTLKLDGSGQSLNLTALDNNLIQNIEKIDITGTGNNSLTLNASDVLDLSSSSNTVMVMGNTGDSVVATGGWIAAGDPANPTTIDGQTYSTYTQGTGPTMATLLVDTDVTTTVS